MSSSTSNSTSILPCDNGGSFESQTTSHPHRLGGSKSEETMSLGGATLRSGQWRCLVAMCGGKWHADRGFIQVLLCSGLFSRGKLTSQLRERQLVFLRRAPSYPMACMRSSDIVGRLHHRLSTSIDASKKLVEWEKQRRHEEFLKSPEFKELLIELALQYYYHGFRSWLKQFLGAKHLLPDSDLSFFQEKTDLDDAPKPNEAALIFVISPTEEVASEGACPGGQTAVDPFFEAADELSTLEISDVLGEATLL
ncbi:hypothetical protein BUALT_Bualt03G0190500 [Buddleja alternifolia]|uniref:Uncharacterized protein n=1 Tax=Buddleja alternifolia TaxID=168488 RepID=A0AAV6Y1V5_9LAMI|nr:hypothetical protein BUALT_Bualt03G0190500 [Buddleja alternifolia]